MERVCFICTSDSYDEISLTGETDVYDYSRQTGIKNYKISSVMLDYPKIDITKIKSDSAFNNSQIILSVLRDKVKSEAYYVIAANAALALHVAGISESIIDCRLAAEEAILSGKAYNKLNELKLFGEKCL